MRAPRNTWDGDYAAGFDAERANGGGGPADGVLAETVRVFI